MTDAELQKKYDVLVDAAREVIETAADDEFFSLDDAVEILREVIE